MLSRKVQITRCHVVSRPVRPCLRWAYWGKYRPSQYSQSRIPRLEGRRDHHTIISGHSSKRQLLTLASGIEGIRGQIQTDYKWEIQVWKKSEESKWTERFSEIFFKDGEGEKQISELFKKKWNTGTDKYMSKTLPSQFISFIITSHGITNTGAMLTLSSEMSHHHHDLRHSRQKVPSILPILTSPPSLSSASVSSHSSSLQVLTVFLVNDDIGGSWPMIININNSGSVIASHFQTHFQTVFNGLAGSGAGVPSGELRTFQMQQKQFPRRCNETVIYFKSQFSTPLLGTYQTSLSCS